MLGWSLALLPADACVGPPAGVVPLAPQSSLGGEGGGGGGGAPGPPAGGICNVMCGADLSMACVSSLRRSKAEARVICNVMLEPGMIRDTWSSSAAAAAVADAPAAPGVHVAAAVDDGAGAPGVHMDTWFAVDAAAVPGVHVAGLLTRLLLLLRSVVGGPT